MQTQRPPQARRTAADASTLTIPDPDGTAKLRTTRIPVQQDDSSVACPGRAMGRGTAAPVPAAGIETMSARTARVVLDEGQYLTAPGEQLAGQLMEFGVDARTGEAVVVYQAMLVSAGGKTVSQRRFEAREAIGGKVEAKPVGES